jgi:hypothetical protein
MGTMMDDSPDRFEDFLREAAQGYNAPPPTPKAELWERISAARKQRGPNGEAGADATIPFRPTAGASVRLRPVLYYSIAAAAILAVGVAIGRMSTPPRGTAVPTQAAVSAPANDSTERQERGALATELVTVEHLTEVDAFLTEFRGRRRGSEFTGQAHDLLSTTRLLLDSKRVSDARVKVLLQDLEGVLAQIATFDSTDRRNELELINDGIAQTHLRTRLRSAIPAGPVRM